MSQQQEGIHLIFLGAPGVGKGTQSLRIAEHYSAAHISTGDILSQAVAERTPLGQQAKSYMDKGELVPDSLIIDLIREKLTTPGFSQNWIMDGFPRTVAQAEAMDQLLAELGQALTVVLNIEVPMDLLMDRLTLRRTCRRTGEIFNLKFNPPADASQYDLYQRDDDKPEAVSRRLAVYTEQTRPLIDYYDSRQMLRVINGDQSLELVQADILSAVSASTH